MTRHAHFDDDAVRRVTELAERPLTLDEFRSWADGDIPADEMEQMTELIRWFLRRYPTPAARLTSARRRYAQASRSIAHARATGRSHDAG